MLKTSTSCIDLKTSASTNTISSGGNTTTTNSNDMEVTMQRTIVNQKKANPTSTADAVTALLQDLKRFGSDHNVILKSSSSNHTIVSIDNSGSTIVPTNDHLNDQQTTTVPSKNNSTLTLNNDNHLNGNNTQLISTVKKKQLEYEFRLKPRSAKSKELLNENGLLDDTAHMCKLDVAQLSLCRRCICCCCGNFDSTLSASSTSNSSSSDEEDDASVLSDHKNSNQVI